LQRRDSVAVKPEISLRKYMSVGCIGAAKRCICTLKSFATSRTSLQNGALRMRRLVDFWYFLQKKAARFSTGLSS
jgi:hypothetical protein